MSNLLTVHQNLPITGRCNERWGSQEPDGHVQDRRVFWAYPKMFVRLPVVGGNKLNNRKWFSAEPEDVPRLSSISSGARSGSKNYPVPTFGPKHASSSVWPATTKWQKCCFTIMRRIRKENVDAGRNAKTGIGVRNALISPVCSPRKIATPPIYVIWHFCIAYNTLLRIAEIAVIRV